MTNKQATEAPERQRTPEQIIGNDAFTQLIFEGYEIVSSGELATAKQAGIDEGLEMAAKVADERAKILAAENGSYDPGTGDETFPDWVVTEMEACEAISATIRALKSEKTNG